MTTPSPSPETLASARFCLALPPETPIHYDLATDRWEPVTQEMFDGLLAQVRDSKIKETEG